MTELGHVVLYVRNLEVSVDFYRGVVGLQLRGVLFDGRAAMLSGGRTHHELLLIEVGDAPAPPRGRRLGLYHIGWKIGEDLNTLRSARERILDRGCKLEGQADHTVSQSLYLCDPDGNEVELYVDDPGVDWRNSDHWLSDPVRPLDL